MKIYGINKNGDHVEAPIEAFFAGDAAYERAEEYAEKHGFCVMMGTHPYQDETGNYPNARIVIRCCTADWEPLKDE